MWVAQGRQVSPLGLDIVASSVPPLPFDEFGGLELVVTVIFLFMSFIDCMLFIGRRLLK